VAANEIVMPSKKTFTNGEDKPIRKTNKRDKNNKHGRRM